MSTATVDPRALAARRRGAIRIMRRRVVAGAVAGFLAIWSVLSSSSSRPATTRG